jgi:P27 family predicted phage terminase small subunit
MPRGPAPQTAAKRTAKGNPGKRAAKPVAIVNAAGETLPNSDLAPSALHVWAAVVPELQRVNLLRPADSNALSRYCDDVVTYWDVTEKLRAGGHTYVTVSVHGTMTRINPLFLIQERIAARLTVLEDRFGLTPAARQTIMVRAAQLAIQASPPFGDPLNANPSDTTKANPLGFLTGAKPVH